MTSIVKLSDGKYYIVSGKKRDLQSKKIIYLVKNRAYYGGTFELGAVGVTTPPELVGKRLRFIVEVVKDGDDGSKFK